MDWRCSKNSLWIKAILERYSDVSVSSIGCRISCADHAAAEVIGIGLNYKDHVEEIKGQTPKQPLLFGMYANAIVGPEQPIVIPQMSQQVDYEAELAVVIGRRARHVSTDSAIDHVAGFTIFNDVSHAICNSQRPVASRKSFDTFAPMGPYLVTTSDLQSGDGLNIELRLNGTTMQKSNTRNMIFKVPELVSHISKVMTLEVGDVIATGTPEESGLAATRGVS
jgi:2-keto-4-pentenoate hydratase/2-oxohepta-3-ene-1,7-dioic acid hydratase in catechol pathway